MALQQGKCIACPPQRIMGYKKPMPDRRLCFIFKATLFLLIKHSTGVSDTKLIKIDLYN